MSPTPKQMGRRLQKLRKEREMSRAQLADLAGITRQYVRQLEAGLSDPTVGTLQKLAKALGVDVTELLG
jgi:transcriptional regulator with XRE-family HTH domain